VDASQGNWCEGLTTYVADYAHRLEQGEEVAREYRLELLRNYTSLVNPAEAFPLNRFRARRDRVTKAVGYDKGALIFHMLHRRLGDGFWRALADLYRERCFTTASWGDLKTYFQRYARQDFDLTTFLDQWLTRTDAPMLRLTGVTYDDEANTLTGQVIQTEPAYDLEMDLLVVSAGKDRWVPIHVDGGVTAFKIPLATSPQRVEADPEAHLFRRLWPEELPASINRLKAAGEVVIETPPRADQETLALAQLLPRALGLKSLPAGTATAKAILWIGAPDQAHLPPGGRIEGGWLHRHGVALSPQTDTQTVFAVWNSNSAGDTRVEAIYWSPTLTAAQAVARKIPHYGKYSYLAFDQGTNTLKGTWPVTTSPLRVNVPMSAGGPP
jgi:hypothetical protein